MKNVFLQCLLQFFKTGSFLLEYISAKKQCNFTFLKKIIAIQIQISGFITRGFFSNFLYPSSCFMMKKKISGRLISMLGMSKLTGPPQFLFRGKAQLFLATKYILIDSKFFIADFQKYTHACLQSFIRKTSQKSECLQSDTPDYF